LAPNAANDAALDTLADGVRPEGDDEHRRQVSEYCAAEFITKPVDFDLLKEQLRQLPSGAA
jgi:hypothetical protein